MTQLVNYGSAPAQLPVAIDYPAALALRQMALVQDELPKYLLAPEINALLHYVPDLHRRMLLATLWNTGARINEALALTRGDFSLVLALSSWQDSVTNMICLAVCTALSAVMKEQLGSAHEKRQEAGE